MNRKLGLPFPWIPLSYGVVGFILMRPLFGPGAPPGVDTPTFLHFAWVSQQAVLGNLSDPFVDPYWYGGILYAQAYSPLAYGGVGLIAAITSISLEFAYKIVMVAAYVAIAIAVHQLALSISTGRWCAIWAGLSVLVSYPMVVAIGIFGWFTTLVALALGLFGFERLLKALDTSSHKAAVLSGVLFAGCLLSHHMTAFGLALALSFWVAHQFWQTNHKRRFLLLLLSMSGTFAVISGVWLTGFIFHLVSVGFEREVPGNWQFQIGDFVSRSSDATWIGAEAYPSYWGIVAAPLTVAGIVHALFARGVPQSIALAAIVMLWFSTGTSGNPIVYVYPFSGLDVARFMIFGLPLYALLSAYFLSQVAVSLNTFARKHRRRLWVGKTLVAGVALAAIVIGLVEVRASAHLLRPFEPPSDVIRGIRWLNSNAANDATVLPIGFRNWAGYWLPAIGGLRILGGWYDEGAVSWKSAREIRRMGWAGAVDIDRVYDIMENRESDFIVIWDWHPSDSPKLFYTEAVNNGSQFTLAATIGEVAIFERSSPSRGN